MYDTMWTIYNEQLEADYLIITELKDKFDRTLDIMKSELNECGLEQDKDFFIFIKERHQESS